MTCQDVLDAGIALAPFVAGGMLCLLFMGWGFLIGYAERSSK